MTHPKDIAVRRAFVIPLLMIAGCRAAPEPTQGVASALKAVAAIGAPLSRIDPATSTVQLAAFEEPTEEPAPAGNAAPAPPPLAETVDAPSAAPAAPAEPIAPGAAARNSSLSLANLEQIAFATNPAIAQAAARVRSLRGKWVQAGLAPNPNAGYVASEIGNDGAEGQQGAYVSQQFIRGGKLYLDQQVACQEIIRAEQALAARRERVRTDVRIGYYDALVAQRRIEVAENLVAVSARAVETSNKLLEAQEIARVALLQTEVEARNARIILRRAQNENAAAWRRLAAIVGQPDLTPHPLEGDIDHIAPELDWKEQLDRLLRESPELAIARAEVRRARWALDRAIAEPIPDVTAQLAAQYDTSTNDSIAGVQIGAPIPLWNKNQGGIQQAESAVVAAVRNVERVELSLRERLADAFQEYSDAKIQTRTYAEQILPKSKETFELVSRGYEAGEVGYLAMLNAQQTYFQTNLAYIESLRDAWRSSQRIDGFLLDGSLRTPVE